MNVLPVSASVPEGAHIFVAGLGYEARSTHAFKELGSAARLRYAIEFQDNHAFSFSENREFFVGKGFTIVPFKERASEKADMRLEVAWVAGLADRILKDVRTAEIDRDKLSVALDVSVMSRDMMALVIEAIWNIAKTHTLTLHLLYSPTTFYLPADHADPVLSAGPASAFFSGWYGYSQIPTALVLGLGLESDRTVWAAERFEPARTIIFAPLGYDSQFDSKLLESNRPLLEGMFDVAWILDRAIATAGEAGPTDIETDNLLEFAKSRLIPFNVSQPIGLFVKLEATCFSLLKEHRVVICPFGPKVFSAVSLLVGLAHFPRIAIWRVSGNVIASPEDRVAAGDVVDAAFRLGENLVAS